ncbi:hypothetical protein GCM10027187_73160 [Streptosporangium sandarakinum]
MRPVSAYSGGTRIWSCPAYPPDLSRVLREPLYFQLGFRGAYGQFRTGRGLETFYARQGFAVLDEGAVFSLRDRLGLPFRIQADPGERIFTRVRGG